MALPPLVVSGSIIAATHINAIRNALASWSFAVEANGQQLHNVGPFNATTGAFSGAVTVSSSLAATSLATPGALTAASATISGGLGAGSANVSGNLTVGGTTTFTGIGTFQGSINVSGAVNASNLATGGTVFGAAGSYTGAVTAGSLSTGGSLTVTGAAAVTGNVTGNQIIANAGMVFQGSASRYVECESQSLAFYKKSGGGFKYYWRRSDSGRLGGGNEKELLTLDDIGTLTLTANSLGAEFLMTYPGSAQNFGLRIADSVRSWMLGLNVGAQGLGKMVLWNNTTGQPMLVFGDSDFWINPTGSQLRRLAVDANGFVKAL